jgi:hypothetical protein
LATGADHVQNRVDHPSPINRSAAQTRSPWQQLAHQLPLAVCQLAGILALRFHRYGSFLRLVPKAVSRSDFSSTKQFQNTFLATVILGDAEWYGSWAGAAVHKCEPGFDIVGTHQTTDSRTIEVRMTKLEMNGQPVLSIAFRRLR